ncbi:invasion associated locus B family protein [Bradyrhizobium tropiciagri]|uniref:invasion associated locus B family protein n=1 Tax=Bradyrhizobium tropiciagri TaxID=312253 RepID=UPI001BA6FB4E|nr:invasion associated locus B family protein [Bradyrhizobium tropiciagri]MBR0893940.1 invasion associated locus B family protein [Bradyrhizobium tropiciagri]
MPIRQPLENNKVQPKRHARAFFVSSQRVAWTVGALIAGCAVSASPFSTRFGWAQTKPSPPAASPAAKPVQPPVGAAPERTAASFGDWILRCEMVGAGEQPVRRCEVAQAIAAKGQQGVIAQVAIGRPGTRVPLRLTMVLPVNVSIPARPRLQASAEDGAPLELSWTECVPAGCLATATVTDEMVGRLASRSEPGSIAFKDAAQRDVGISLSFRGLAQAMAALGKD